MILVLGGSGTLGRELTTRLAAAGHEVRVLTRDRARADGLPVDVSVGDVRDPAAVRTAVRGCDKVVSAMHGFVGGRGAGPEAIDDRANAELVRAATEAGVDHLVLLSVLDARPDHPMSLHRAKFAAERHLAASGLSGTALRPGAYIETWTGIVGAKLAAGGPALVFGRGRNPINFVSARDVAAAVQQAIDDPALRGRVVDVAGPANLTMTEFATALGATKINHIPRAALHVLAVAARPASPAFARQAAAAVAMDTVTMSADATETRATFPSVEWHSVADVVGSAG